MAVQLYLGASLAIASGILFAVVGRSVSRRRVSPEARRASDLFATWWFGLAAITALGAANSLVAAAGVRSLGLFVSSTMISLLGICIALFGLVYYLLYLFTGKRGVFAPLAVGYVLYFAFLVWFVIESDPAGVAVGRWSVTLAYANEQAADGLVVQLLLGLLILPPIAGALAYFTLYFRAREAEQRYRIAMVSWSIIVWFGAAYAASLGHFSQQDWWQLASRVLGLLAATATLMAYRPPLWVKKRFTPLRSDEQAAVIEPQLRMLPAASLV